MRTARWRRGSWGLVMGHSRVKAKGRRDGGFFVAFPSIVLDSVEYAALSSPAVKLMIDISAQYRWNSHSETGNNGDMSLAWSIMSKRGWRSRDTLNRARHELLESGWIIISRQGGRRVPTLYALTFFSVDECKDKLDIKPTQKPPSTWKGKISLTRPSDNCSPMGVPKVAKHAVMS